jgi:regulator of extracellular matrix RemA (YlzA/DUF370 family)
MSSLLHVGFYNYVTSENVIALLDYKLAASKKIVKSAKEEKPRSVMDVTKGRKAQTLIVLTGDRYIISAIYRQRLAKRLGAVPEIEQSEILPSISTGTPSYASTILDSHGETTRLKGKDSKEAPLD